MLLAEVLLALVLSSILISRESKLRRGRFELTSNRLMAVAIYLAKVVGVKGTSKGWVQ